MDIDTILGVVGTVLGVIGLVTGYIFYRKSLRLKEPLYAITSNNLIQDNVANMSGLEIYYKGYRIENLTVSKVVLWNSGQDTIKNDDIVSANPLRIECANGYQILDISIIRANNPSSQFGVELDKDVSNAQVTFDYLDNKQGAVVQIVHTGKNSSDIQLKGDLKGAQLRLYTSKWHTSKWHTSEIITWIIAISTIVGQIAFKLAEGFSGFVRVGISLAVTILSFGLLACVASWILKKRSAQLPNDLLRLAQITER